MNTEKLMKKCQVGAHKLDDANNLLAECYGVIGVLIDNIESMGVRNNECTKPITGNVCANCGCKYAKKTN